MGTTVSDELALELMRFGADVLKCQCPPFLPDIEITPDASDLGQYQQLTIRLKQWRDGNVIDQAILAHEIVHHIQYFHGLPWSEIEAIAVMCMWLKSKGEDPRKLISFNTIHRLTGDRDFASLKWLEAA